MRKLIAKMIRTISTRDNKGILNVTQYRRNKKRYSNMLSKLIQPKLKLSKRQIRRFGDKGGVIINGSRKYRATITE